MCFEVVKCIARINKTKKKENIKEEKKAFTVRSVHLTLFKY